MARTVNRILGRTMGVSVIRAREQEGAVDPKQPPKPVPYPLDAKSLRRILCLRDYLDRVKHVPGDVVECGVATGYSLFSMIEIDRLLGPGRRFWGFDSFQGLPEPTAEDEAEKNPARVKSGRFAIERREVVNRMRANGLSEDVLQDRVRLVEGWLDQTLDSYDGSGIALLHLDVDLYESYKVALEKLFPRVVPGGLVAFDEYDDKVWVGARKAISEYLGDSVPIHLSEILPNRAFVIKP